MKKILIISRLLYLVLAILSLYLLLISRSGEVHTVWQYMHPMFLPLFFTASTLLVAIVFSSEKVEYKLLFIFIHSIISHSLFTIIFPAGYIGFQQNVLGITRRVFDGISPHGYGGTAESILLRIYNSFRNNNFQVVYSVTFARAFALDVFWIHLLQAPMLWGMFIPTVTFVITKTLGGNEKISALASLLGSAFPLLIYLGALSVPNSLGFIFFLGSFYFFLKYLISPKSKCTYLMLFFSFASFLCHFLTGFISLSFLLLVLSLKNYAKEKAGSPHFAKLSLFLSFVLATSILPCALIFQGIFVPTSAHFSTDRIYEYTTTELVGQFLLGEYLYYPPHLILLFIAGPLIAFAWVIYNLYALRNQRPSDNTRIFMKYFLLGFLMLWIDYCVLKIFMMNVPFNEERLWVFRDLLSVPLAALAISKSPALLRPIGKYLILNTELLRRSLLTHALLRRISLKVAWIAKFPHTYKRRLYLILNVSILVLLAGWITSSVYHAYPHYSALQTTSYELEAVKYIDETTYKDYVVIADQWISYAGLMIVGVQNPRAYYFPDYDPRGAALFTKMKNNPSPEVLIEAMNYTETEVAYFIMTKPRLGEEEYNLTIQQAQQNDLPTYKIFYYKGEERLRIFFHEMT